MEEDVGRGSGISVSKMPLSGELPPELLSESMGGENEVEGSYEEGDEGEIMVEIVGSDVFVNGVSGHTGEELVGQKISESMDVWNEGDVLDEEVWNPESSEEKVVKCELLNRRVETVGKVQTSEKEQIKIDQLDENSPMFHKATNASNGAQIDPNVQFGGINVAVGEVVFKAKIDENEVFALESKDSIAKVGSLFKMYQPTPANEGNFGQSDLIWGKLQNDLWWPGQIFNQADASEKAMKYYKTDSHLVAYFGEQTFSWNDASVLKPFMPHFSQIEKQSNSEAFQTAVDSALEEVSRRVELGLTCSCIPKGAYIKIGTQIVENPGIREESRRRCGIDHSSRAASFEPDKLLNYITNLALSASSDRLDLAIAKAQLFPFFRFKGYHSSSELDKGRCTPINDSHSMKQKSLTELMAEGDFGKSLSPRKRKALDPLANGSDKRVNFHAAKLSSSMVPSPIFGQIGGSSKMLSPEKKQNIWDYKSSNKLDRKRKAEPTTGGTREGFEFVDTNDSYWKDRIVQNHSGEQPSIIQSYSGEQLRRDWQNRAANPQPLTENLIKTGLTSHSRKKSEPNDVIRPKQWSSLPAELILNFGEGKYVPSEINLNKMFRRFGSLMESETEADRESGRAKVIFKRGSDAEVARNSAEKFNIFGPVDVKYVIGHSPLISVKVSPLTIPQCPEGDQLPLQSNGSQNGMLEEGKLDNVMAIRN